eukprot:COSAG02_NODE_6588_length_3475_cov_1.668839_1_plen_57_part_10
MRPTDCQNSAVVHRNQDFDRILSPAMAGPTTRMPPAGHSAALTPQCDWGYNVLYIHC